MEFRYAAIITLFILIISYVFSLKYYNYRTYVIGNRYSNYENSIFPCVSFFESFGFCEIFLLFYLFFNLKLAYLVIILLILLIKYSAVILFVLPRMSQFFGMLSIVDVFEYIYGKKYKLYFSFCVIAFCVVFLGFILNFYSSIINIFFDTTQLNSVFILILAGFFISTFGGVNAILNLYKSYSYFCFFLLFIITNIIIYKDNGTMFSNYDTVNYAQLYNYSDENLLNYFLLLFCVPILTPSFMQKILISPNILYIFKHGIISIFMYLFCIVIIFIFYFLILSIANLNDISIVCVMRNIIFVKEIRPFFIAWIFLSVIITIAMCINIISNIFCKDVIETSCKLKLSNYFKIFINKIIATITILLIVYAFTWIKFSMNNIVMLMCFWQFAFSMPFLVYILNINNHKNEIVVKFSIFFNIAFFVLSQFYSVLNSGVFCMTALFVVSNLWLNLRREWMYDWGGK